MSNTAVPLVTRESLNEEDVELRIWHAGDVTSNVALCGFKGEWVGVGLIVTCEDCLKLMEKK